ncbi:flagellar assembly peptidoglycan hydrolase FlgJ [Dyella sp.]|jgi:flagellar protein FlgJ|uniref:flagellar assembly peptidoglycan hydrolase FlgJ n=1 Tax=Dyella sp. TaxID=1869338 RepID=UPI002D76FAE1|nr:flagellar assembly peptidoglycan hydrolase FlgJ [Dyella sp.]HET6433846.1 flagellar assembly peptidoglycan hydrolase FlgJ [Dyella sp.]
MAAGIDSAAQNLNTWTDLSGFSALRQSAQADAKSALPVVAKQFESIFTQMVLKSMRDASFGDPNFDSQASDSWQGLADQQLAVTLSNQGHGLGIAEMLVRQLGGKDAPTPAGANGVAAKYGSEDGWLSRLGSVARAAGSAAARTASHFIPGDPVDFVTKMAPFAQKAAEKLGVSVRAVLAQAALETQWGKHMPQHGDGTPSFNLFGMKAGSSWDGGRVNVPTLEVEGGVPVRRRAAFRAYESPAQSFDDYARLLGDNPRYAQALGKGDDVAGFARGLVQGGYATDPAYAHKIAAIANGPAMRQALDALKNGVTTPMSSE